MKSQNVSRKYKLIFCLPFLQHCYFCSGETYPLQEGPTESAKKTRLLRILKLLKLLAALEKQTKDKQKAAHGASTEKLKHVLAEEFSMKKPTKNELIDENFAKQPLTHKPNAKSNGDLAALLNFIHGEDTTKASKMEVDNSIDQLVNIYISCKITQTKFQYQRVGYNYISNISTTWYWILSCVILYLSDSTLCTSILHSFLFPVTVVKGKVPKHHSYFYSVVLQFFLCYSISIR